MSDNTGYTADGTNKRFVLENLASGTGRWIFEQLPSASHAVRRGERAWHVPLKQFDTKVANFSPAWQTPSGLATIYRKNGYHSLI